jgi:putative ABC transport system permease protein
MANLKLAVRTLVKTPFVTMVAIASLALGIGANTAIFSLIDLLLRRPLPVGDPSTLVNLSAPGPKPGSTSCNQAGSCEDVFTYPMFRDLERVQTPFTGIAAHRVFGANIVAAGQTTSGDGMAVSGTYFPLLGLQPAVGRLLGPDDDRVEGESHVAVLTHSFWQTRFAGSPDVLAEKLIVNGQPMTIVGVAPRGFDGTTITAKPQVFVPITMRALMQPGAGVFADRRSYWAYLFARLKPRTTIEQARAAIAPAYTAILVDVEAPLQKGMSDQTMARFRARQLGIEPGARGQSDVAEEATAPLTLLLGVTLIVLLIACANIANLLLARSAARTNEMAVRLSLGANRRQLIGQLLTESFLLAFAGGAAGLLVARWTLDLMLILLPAEAQTVIAVQLSWPILAFATAITLATGFLFGLYPAIHSTRLDLIASIKGQAGQPSGGRAASRFRMSLATAQIALSMALLVSAGLFAKSLLNVTRVDLGLNADQVVTFRVSPQLNGYPPERIRQIAQQIGEELAAVPGATAVTVGRVPLLAGSNNNQSVSVEGFQWGPDTDTTSRVNDVGPLYFSTLDIPLLAGREFTPSDALGTSKVAIVNEAFARKFNLGANVVGKMMAAERTNKLDTLIVGFARDAKYSEVKDEVPPQFFRPLLQNERIGSMTFYVRTAIDADAFVANIPRTIARVDPNLPVEDLRTLPQQVRENVFLDRFISTLTTSFAALATLLAAIGLYGVLAYTISQRTREIGVRMALGAAPARVRGMVLRQVGVMTAIGGAIGLAGAWGAGRLAQSLLYNLDPGDPPVLLSAAAGLAIVSLAAGIIPAIRASQVDPMRALRYE